LFKTNAVKNYIRLTLITFVAIIVSAFLVIKLIENKIKGEVTTVIE